MRKLSILSPLLLAACASAPPPAEPAEIPVRGETPGRTCNAAGADRFIGQPRSEATGSTIKRATNSAVLRWAPPGTMMTMDYRGDRVTVYLGPDGNITKINCG
jgi:hypothetical protein